MAGKGMRSFYMAAAVVWLGTGCAQVPLAPSKASELEAERWQRQYEEARESANALALQLAAAQAALEVRAQERAEAEQLQALWREELQEEQARAEVERRTLEEANAQLRARQRELTEMHEEVSDGWYESAMSRARRHLPAKPAPAEGPGESGGGNGGAP